jgi:glycosyltransferase involved in cell wall biosynthesis
VKIAHVTATFPPYLAGTGNVALENARAVARLGHDITVYTARAQNAADDERSEFRVRRLRSVFRIGNAPLLPGLLHLRSYDLVHLHYPFIFGAELVLLGRKFGTQPYVVTYHNDLVSPGLKGRLFELYETISPRWVLGSARTVIVTSWDGCSASPVVGPLVRRDPTRFVEIPNGVDVAHFHPNADQSEARARLGVRDTGPMLVFVGAMDAAHEHKGGVAILLEAVARLADPKPILVLVGGGDRVQAYVARAERLGLSDVVRFVGWVPHSDLPGYLAAADIVVQPSQQIEQFGMVAIEAMACGTPVVVSNLPGVRQVVRDAGGGLLARPGDPDDLADRIACLLADRTERTRLGAIGRRSVSAAYDWAVIGRSLEGVYQRALGDA